MHINKKSDDLVGKIYFANGSENGIRPLFVSFPLFLPCMGRRGFPVVVDEVVVEL